MLKSLTIILSLSCFILSGCSMGLDKEEYITWVSSYENGLHVRQKHGEFVFDVQYQPPEYVYLLQNGHLPSTAEEKEGLVVLSDMQYYKLSVGLSDQNKDFISWNTNSKGQRDKKKHYFSYQFEKDIWLEDEGKRYPCQLFHYEQSIDLKPSRTFVLAFENPNGGSEGSKLMIDAEWTGSPVMIRVNKQGPDF
ncbi:MAG: hypothetical protein WBB45_07545 [Cyclobacteriaceae bacterium]